MVSISATLDTSNVQTFQRLFRPVPNISPIQVESGLGPVRNDNLTYNILNKVNSFTSFMYLGLYLISNGEGQYQQLSLSHKFVFFL